MPSRPLALNGKASFKARSDERLSCNSDRRHSVKRRSAFVTSALVSLAMSEGPFILEKVDGVMDAFEGACHPIGERYLKGNREIDVSQHRNPPFNDNSGATYLVFVARFSRATQQHDRSYPASARIEFTSTFKSVGFPMLRALESSAY